MNECLISAMVTTHSYTPHQWWQRKIQLGTSVKICEWEYCRRWAATEWEQCNSNVYLAAILTAYVVTMLTILRLGGWVTIPAANFFVPNFFISNWWVCHVMEVDLITALFHSYLHSTAHNLLQSISDARVCGHTLSCPFIPWNWSWVWPAIHWMGSYILC